MRAQGVVCLAGIMFAGQTNAGFPFYSGAPDPLLPLESLSYGSGWPALGRFSFTPKIPLFRGLNKDHVTFLPVDGVKDDGSIAKFIKNYDLSRELRFNGKNFKVLPKRNRGLPVVQLKGPEFDDILRGLEISKGLSLDGPLIREFQAEKAQADYSSLIGKHKFPLKSPFIRGLDVGILGPFAHLQPQSYPVRGSLSFNAPSIKQGLPIGEGEQVTVLQLPAPIPIHKEIIPVQKPIQVVEEVHDLKTPIIRNAGLVEIPAPQLHLNHHKFAPLVQKPQLYQAKQVYPQPVKIIEPSPVLLQKQIIPVQEEQHQVYRHREHQQPIYLVEEPQVQKVHVRPVHDSHHHHQEQQEEVQVVPDVQQNVEIYRKPVHAIPSQRLKHTIHTQHVAPVHQEVYRAIPVHEEAQHEAHQEVHHEPVQREVQHSVQHEHVEQQEVHHVDQVPQHVQHVVPAHRAVQHVLPVHQHVPRVHHIRKEIHAVPVQQEVHHAVPVQQEVHHAVPVQQHIQHAPQIHQEVHHAAPVQHQVQQIHQEIQHAPQIHEHHAVPVQHHVQHVPQIQHAAPVQHHVQHVPHHQVQQTVSAHEPVQHAVPAHQEVQHIQQDEHHAAQVHHHVHQAAPIQQEVHHAVPVQQHVHHAVQQEVHHEQPHHIHQEVHHAAPVHQEHSAHHEIPQQAVHAQPNHVHHYEHTVHHVRPAQHVVTHEHLHEKLDERKVALHAAPAVHAGPVHVVPEATASHGGGNSHQYVEIHHSQGVKVEHTPVEKEVQPVLPEAPIVVHAEHHDEKETPEASETNEPHQQSHSKRRFYRKKKAKASSASASEPKATIIDLEKIVESKKKD